MDEGVAKLLEELMAHRQSLDRPPNAASAFPGVWRGLLLVHRVRGGELDDPESVLEHHEVVLDAPPSKQARVEIGTDGCVFCSVAVAPYWEPPVVLLFGPLDDERIATDRWTAPWDTRGAAREGNTKGLSPWNLVARYSLPAPVDEEYLPLHLDTCFHDLEHFLDGERPVREDAAGVFRRLVHESPRGDLCWLHTPESRFVDGVRIAGDLLRAVFVDEEALTTEGQLKTAAVLRRLVEESNGTYRSLLRRGGAVDYPAEVAAFMKQWLQEEGWWP